MHPNGQIPAYEWNFGDVNPPVHAWATIFTYRLEKAPHGRGRQGLAQEQLPEAAAELHLVGQPQGPIGRNVFEGGFLGLDNIGVFDRSAPLPTGGYLEQADGTAWMALLLPEHARNRRGAGADDPDYADMALKFVEHFLWIASAMTHIGRRRRDVGRGGRLLLRRAAAPDGEAQRLKVRSMVGLLPLCAATVFSGTPSRSCPELQRSTGWFLDRRPDSDQQDCTTRARPASRGRRLLSLLERAEPAPRA